MAKPNDDKMDGLEIISIGTLHDGPWNKKYWSSSRGKDRYPLPVGYQATRTHNGITYKMEISEGLKGPLFTINSTEGHSCSGQTPDIAWERFHKKGYTRLKLLRGKRFSGKMDGVEFFGFKNPNVQRLLRELVVNANGTGEPKLLSTRIHNATSRTEHNTDSTESCTSPDLLRSSVKNRSNRMPNMKSVGDASLKRLRPENQKQKVDASSSIKRSHRDHIHGSASISSAPKEEDENNLLSAELVRSEDIKVQEESIKKAVENERKLSIPNDQAVNDMDLCAPDTLDLPQEDTSITMVDIPKESHCNITNELITAHKAPSEDLAADSLPEEEMVTPSANANSEKSEHDSVGGAMANSMMTVLLPRALPLLKTFSRKKRTTSNLAQSPPLKTRTLEKRNQTELVGVHIGNTYLDSSVSNIGVATSVAPDSLEDDQGLNTVTDEKSNQTDPVGVHITNTYFDSRVSNTGNVTSVTPDSLENDQGPNTMTDEKSNQTDPVGVHIANTYLDSRVSNTGDVASIASDSLENDQGLNTVTDEKSNQTHPVGVHIANTYLDSRVSNTRDVTSIAPDSLENDQGLNTVTDEKSNQTHPVGVHIANTYLDSRVSNIGDVTSIAPDSLESDQGLNAVTDEFPLPKDVAECDKSTIGHIETNDSKLSSCSKVHLASKGVGCILSTDFDSRLCNCGDITSVVPDSFEDDQSQKPVSDQLPLSDDIDVHAQIIGATAGKRDDELIDKGNAAEILPQETNVKMGEGATDNPLGHCNTPLAESIICRNFSEVRAADVERDPLGDEARLDPPPHNMRMEKSYVNSEGALCYVGPEPDELQTKEIVSTSVCSDSSGFTGQFVSSKTKLQSTETSIKPNNELDNLQLVGCYLHPMPISLVLLSTKEKETYICVLSGLFKEKNTLFIYKIPIEGKQIGLPSFIGHASLLVSVSRDAFGREIALDSSGLQLTPDGGYLVLLNSIRASCCSEQKIHCPCSTCTSDCFSKNVVNVVQVKLGYVSVVVRLETTDSVRCILVCEPNYLLAADEGGRLYLWLMNSTWSAPTEEHNLPTSNSLTPYIVELKKIPYFAGLVIGHNGFGEFVLWDIFKRILVSRFSAPTISVSRVLPVSLFRWKNPGIVPAGHDTEEHINDILDQIKMCSKGGDNRHFHPLDGDDVAIWLLISTAPEPGVLHGLPSNGFENNPVGSWRLALLVKNIVLQGNALDPSVVAICTSDGHGIVGTYDGLVYMWELSTGIKIGDLHSFEGGGVSCIATDESTGSSVVAIAGDGGQLRLYLNYSQAKEAATPQII